VPIVKPSLTGKPSKALKTARKDTDSTGSGILLRKVKYRDR
jgi:hypothetical protein